MERKDFFKKGIFQALKKAIDATEEVYDIVHKSVSGEQPVSNVVKPVDKKVYTPLTPILPKVLKSKKINRLKLPPGALKDKKKFYEKCTGCGDCIDACPYNTIFPVFDSKSKKNYPYLDPNMKACMLCITYPCIKSCKENALKPLKKKEYPKFGKAKFIIEHCINHRTGANTCNVCQTSCPVKDVVSYTKKFLPKFSKDCTGCGVCVAACPPHLKAIVIK